MGTDPSNTFNMITDFTDTLVGIRNQLVQQGFSPDIAESIILESIKMQNQGN